MEKEVIFLYGAAALAFGFAAANGIIMAMMRKKTGRTEATVVSYKTVSPENCKRFNSKWAQVSYQANHNMYTSSQYIQVSMAAVIGSKVTVYYNKEHPHKLYSFSLKRIWIGSLIGLIMLGAAVGREFYF